MWGPVGKLLFTQLYQIIWLLCFDNSIMVLSDVNAGETRWSGHRNLYCFCNFSVILNFFRNNRRKEEDSCNYTCLFFISLQSSTYICGSSCWNLCPLQASELTALLPWTVSCTSKPSCEHHSHFPLSQRAGLTSAPLTALLLLLSYLPGQLATEKLSLLNRDQRQTNDSLFYKGAG